MQVSDVQDHITHAVITSQAAIECTITENADFFHMLSATLYSNQKEAVVREIICNANDALIAAGRSHIPVKITLDSKELTIEDAGFGIAHDKIGEIYGTYGGSTKLNDGKQTGGFGLGSKAPWAYTEQFTVISSHMGVRTIYNMSKSSAEVAGKPSIIPLTSFPTQETGLIVKVPLKAGDSHAFRDEVTSIVARGGINAVLNEKQIEVLPYADLAGSRFLMFPSTPHSIEETGVYVRYGQVVYPVDGSNALISSKFRDVWKLVQKIYCNVLIIDADPNTITVTPSRESLSMQTKTTNTLLRLFNEFLQKYGNVIDKTKFHEDEYNRIYDDLLLNNPKAPLLTSFSADYFHLAYVKLQKLNSDHVITTTQAMERMLIKGGTSFDILKNVMFKRISSYMKQTCVTNPGLVQTFFKTFASPDHFGPWEKGGTHRWWYSHVFAPIQQRLEKATDISIDNLYVVNHPTGVPVKGRYSWQNSTRIVDTIKAINAGVLIVNKVMNYLFPIVVLGHNREDIEDLGRINAKMPNIGPQIFAGAYLGFVVPHSKKRIEEAKKIFGSMRVILIDLTVDQSLRQQQLRDERLAKNSQVLLVGSTISVQAKEDLPKRAKDSYPCLAGALTPNSNHVDVSKVITSRENLITDPDWFYENSLYMMREEHQILRPFDESATPLVLKLFGSKGAYASTPLRAQNLTDKGVKELSDFIVPKVVSRIMTCPEIKELCEKTAEYDYLMIFKSGWNAGQITEWVTVLNSPAVRKKFGYDFTISDETTDYFVLYKYMAKKSWSSVNMPLMADAANYIKSLKPTKELQETALKAMTSTMSKYLDMETLITVLGNRNPASVQEAIKLLDFALNN